MTERFPFVVIVVLNWNQHLLTKQCVESLLNINYTNYRILVVDNGSTDDSAKKLTQEFGNKLSLISNPTNLGFAGGNNIGIKRALADGADFILVLNNDTVVDQDFLSPLIREMMRDRMAAAANPKIYLLGKEDIFWAAGGRTNLIWGLLGNRGSGQPDRGQFEATEEIDFGTGCCLLIRSEAVEKLGLLNENYFAYFEDADWSLRARKLGYKIIYVPAAKIWHAAGASSKGGRTLRGTTHPILYFLTARNHLWFLKTHTRGWQRATSITGYLLSKIVFYSIIFLVLGRIEKLKALWRGFGEGLAPAPAPEIVEALVPSIHSEV